MSKPMTEAEVFTLLSELVSELRQIRIAVERLMMYRARELEAGGYIV